MYQCSRGDGDSCGKCLLLDRDLKCGWCEKQEKCMLCDDCTGRACTSVSGGVYPGWLDEALKNIILELTIEMAFCPESLVYCISKQRMHKKQKKSSILCGTSPSSINLKFFPLLSV